MKLTKAACDAAKPNTILRDSAIGGFYLKCGGRAKTFILQRDVWEGGVRTRTVHHSIGRFDKGVTVEAARTEARRIDAEPQRLARGGKTFADAIELFNAEARADKTVKRYAQLVRRGYLESWMDRPLKSITREEAFDRHQALAKEVASGKYADERTPSRRADGRTTANDVMRWFRAVWNRAMKADETLPVCPTINVTWHKVTRKRSAIPEGKLAQWHKGVRTIDNPVRRDYLLFALYSGLRRDSAATARWEDVDLKQRVLRVPKPKGGEERAFDLPLSDQLVKILKGRKAENVTLARQQRLPADALEWVFPAYSASGHIEEPRTDIPGVPFTIHDLRRTFITVAERLDISPYVIGSLVNHRQPGGSVTAGYVRHELDRLREPMQKIADGLENKQSN
jgi:integrase